MPVVIVRSTAPHGHFRAGRKFGRDADVYDLDSAALEMVKADPRLVIVESPERSQVTPVASSDETVPMPTGKKSKG